LLKDEFAVERVVLFGSLAHEDLFNQWSDVDLAAWGLTSSNWLRAISAVHQLSNEIEINLVDGTSCPPEMLAAIEREGSEI
jgi:predicted nucleotidyltransferase